MGAPTSNRKRGGYFFSLKNLSSPSSPLDSDSSGGLHVAKKPKLLSLPPMNPNPERQQSTFSRVSQYPQPQPLKREVHAPRSSFKFSGKILDFLKAKTKAFATLRHVGKEKGVVDVDKECSNSKGLVFDDEEVQILDDKSGGIAQKSVETKEDAFLRETYLSFDDAGLGGSSSLVSDLSNQTPRDDDCTIISVSRPVELTEPPHKRLYKEAGSRDSKLCYLDFLIAFNSKKLSFHRKPAESPKQDLLKEAFVELTNDEEDEVSKALSNSSRRKLLVTHADSNIEITGEVLQCLGPRAWLNDEVINLYLELLKEREKREPQKFLKCHFFNTFFYKKLMSGRGVYDFKAVRRWTTQRKIGYALIDCDKIFVPIHKEIHWCLAIINKKDKKFQYLDSLKGKDPRVLQVLAKYYVDEVKDKSAKDIDVSSWEQEYVLDLPAQENGYDCGMFMIKYADFYSRGLGLAFRQMHMPYFRKRTAKEILRLKAE